MRIEKIRKRELPCQQDDSVDLEIASNLDCDAPCSCKSAVRVQAIPCSPRGIISTYHLTNEISNSRFWSTSMPACELVGFLFLKPLSFCVLCLDQHQCCDGIFVIIMWSNLSTTKKLLESRKLLH